MATLRQCTEFNGNRVEGKFFSEVSGVERAAVGHNYGPAHADKRMYTIDVLHSNFPVDLPLRGTLLAGICVLTAQTSSVGTEG